jgi:hypothetical protein
VKIENRSYKLYIFTVSLRLTLAEHFVMRVPAQPGIRTLRAGNTPVVLANPADIRRQIIGWSLIGALTALVVLTISLYPG